jgi:hypothetical protein
LSVVVVGSIVPKLYGSQWHKCRTKFCENRAIRVYVEVVIETKEAEKAV